MVPVHVVAGSVLVRSVPVVGGGAGGRCGGMSRECELVRSARFGSPSAQALLFFKHANVKRAQVHRPPGVARKVALRAVVVVLGPAPARDAVLPEP